MWPSWRQKVRVRSGATLFPSLLSPATPGRTFRNVELQAQRWLIPTWCISKRRYQNTKSGHSSNSASPVPMFRATNLQGLGRWQRVTVNSSQAGVMASNSLLPDCMVQMACEGIQEKPVGWDTQGSSLEEAELRRRSGLKHREFSG